MKKADSKEFFYERIRVKSTANMNSKIHVHKNYELYYTISGECRYFIGDRVLSLSENCLVLIPRGIPHRTVYTSQECERVLLFFPADYINPTILPKLYKIFPSRLFSAKKGQTEKIIKIFERISEEEKKNDEFSRELIKGYLTELFSIILRSGADREGGAYEKANIVIYDAMQYISAHFAEEISLKDLAMRSAMSECSFSRTFKNVSGFGFKEYLASVRLQKAEELLINTSLSVSEIAYACGFNDSNYFSSFFSKAKGTSPLKFRKTNTSIDI